MKQHVEQNKEKLAKKKKQSREKGNGRRGCPLCNLCGFQKLCLPRDTPMTARDTLSKTHILEVLAEAVSCCVIAVMQQFSQPVCCTGWRLNAGKAAPAQPAVRRAGLMSPQLFFLPSLLLPRHPPHDPLPLHTTSAPG